MERYREEVETTRNYQRNNLKNNFEIPPSGDRKKRGALDTRNFLGFLLWFFLFGRFLLFLVRFDTFEVVSRSDLNF